MAGYRCFCMPGTDGSSGSDESRIFSDSPGNRAPKHFSCQPAVQAMSPIRSRVQSLYRQPCGQSAP
ncbi:hypothetical protein Tdes44962_MAKER06085, partial [Teratosphaeria destructans]